MYGLIIIAYHILDKCCNYIKEDDLLFQQKVKNTTNNLLKFITPVINKHNQFAIQDGSEEEISEQIQVRTECVELLNEIFLEKHVTVYDMRMILSNIKQGKRVYTQEELEYYGKL